MNDVSKVLREARRLIAEVGWTKGEYARDVAGESVWPTNTGAVCFCSVGAIKRARIKVGGARDNGFVEAIDVLLAAVGDGSGNVVRWNDSRSDVSEVLAAFDKAIEIAEAS